MSFLSHRLDQVATYWPPVSGAPGVPVLLAPGAAAGGCRWTLQTPKIHTEAQRAVAAVASLLSVTELAPGGFVAPGNQVAVAAAVAVGVHEVASVKATRGLLGGIVRRADLRPLSVILNQTVQVFRMVRQASGRGYVVVRGGSIYSGLASVDQMSTSQREEWAGSPVARYDTWVTLPYAAALLEAARLDVLWTGPFGSAVIECQGGAFANVQSPFLATLPGVLRRAQTGVAP